jgi:hypothetical protein
VPGCWALFNIFQRVTNMPAHHQMCLFLFFLRVFRDVVGDDFPSSLSWEILWIINFDLVKCECECVFRSVLDLAGQISRMSKGHAIFHPMIFHFSENPSNCLCVCTPSDFPGEPIRRWNLDYYDYYRFDEAFFFSFSTVLLWRRKVATRAVEMKFSWSGSQLTEAWWKDDVKEELP